jgi:hypothetical protein
LICEGFNSWSEKEILNPDVPRIEGSLGSFDLHEVGGEGTGIRELCAVILNCKVIRDLDISETSNRSNISVIK